MVSACILNGIIRAKIPLDKRVQWGGARTVGIKYAEHVSLAELAMVCDWCAWWPRLLLCWNILDWTHPVGHSILSWTVADPKFGQADKDLSVGYRLGAGPHPLDYGFSPHVDASRHYAGLSSPHVQAMEHGHEFAARCINLGVSVNHLRHLVLQWAIGFKHEPTRLHPMCALMNTLLARLSPDLRLHADHPDRRYPDYSQADSIEAERLLTALILTGSDDGSGFLDLTSPHPHHYDGGINAPYPCRLATLTDRLASMHCRNLGCVMSANLARNAARVMHVHETTLRRRELVRHFRRSLLPTLLSLGFLPAREMLPEIAAYALCPISDPARLEEPHEPLSPLPTHPHTTTAPILTPKQSCSIA
jgi:hypothetical protein